MYSTSCFELQDFTRFGLGVIILKEKTWYKLEITQLSENSKVFLFIYSFQHLLSTLNLFFSNIPFQYYVEVKVDGEVKGQRVENPEPMQFTDVKVWMSTGQYGFPPANVFIRNLQY